MEFVVEVVDEIGLEGIRETGFEPSVAVTGDAGLWRWSVVPRRMRSLDLEELLGLSARST